MTQYAASRRAWAAYLGVDDLDPVVITAEQAQAYRQYLVAVDGCQPATINGHQAVLRTWGRWADKLGEPNFARHLPDLRLAAYRPRALERKDLLRAVRDHGSIRDQALMYRLVQAGLRAAETAALQVGGVELSERQGTVQVRQARTIPLPVEARTARQAYLAERGTVAATAPLFPAQRGVTAGKPIRPRAVWDVVKKYARLAQLDDVTPHVVRQCAASRSVARDTYATATLETSGHDLRLVQHLLGHRRIETTARYLKPSAEAAEAAANGLSAWLGAEAEPPDREL
ncbi:MAG: tyrosine-type recombinase/integrase [Chloroflexi bacterium]|nr:tyrosine-type recombinase/integrase [Chloroflexota bacterium]MBU1747424.1 tyrosine-type recombinase/integrase [Chloroflexota bacterium]